MKWETYTYIKEQEKKNLGVIFTNKLSLEKHINKITWEAYI